MDIKNNIHKVIIGLVVLAVFYGGYSLFLRTTPFEAGRDGGRIEINEDEVYKYFIFVSADEARMLLTRSRDRGEFTFLFPQVDLSNFDKLIIQEREMTTSRGERVALLGIEGLPADSVISSNIDGTIRASVLEYDDSNIADLAIFTGETGDFISEFYVPFIPGENNMSSEIQGVMDVTFGTPLFEIADGAYLNRDVFPNTWQMALVIESSTGANGNGAVGSTLDNVLTKYGKIVMVEK